jgi:transcriptional regulator with XRE-family HTH domain
MQDFAKRLHAIRKRKDFSVDQLAKALNVSRQAVHKWEAGSSVPRSDKLTRMAEVLGVSEEELRSGEVTGPQNEVLVPVWGRIAATPFRLSDTSVAKWYTPGSSRDKGNFALQIDGDSMMPLYRNNELIFIKPYDLALTPYPPEGDDNAIYVPYERVAFLNGKDVVITHNDDSSFKRLSIQRGKGMSYTVNIISLNPEYPKTTVRMGDVFVVHGLCYHSEMPR